MKRLNPEWVKDRRDKIKSGGNIDDTISYHAAAQWLIVALSENDRPFRVYNLGGGVKRITTDADACPCCKRPLDKKER